MSGATTGMIGRVVGNRYRLERAIGSGGMGVVFEATELELGRSVAVKLLLDVDPRRVARLRQEALASGSLSCPHVVSVFDFQAPAGEPAFIVMELLQGHSLSKLLDHEPILAPGRAALIASQMLVGLEAAHRIGVVHRDVKPSNTWLVFGPGVVEHVKILDFGVAKVLEGAALRTTTGAVLGTPAYLAPEQLRGLPLDARVDIHAVGVVLFEMLTGARPWRSDTASVYAEILERRPPPVHLLAPGIPPGLSSVVECALAKDPAGRFSRAADMRMALEPFVGPRSSMPATVRGGLGAETGDWRQGDVVTATASSRALSGGRADGAGRTLGTATTDAQPAFPPAADGFVQMVPWQRPGAEVPAQLGPPPQQVAEARGRRPGSARPFLVGGAITVVFGVGLFVAFLFGRTRGDGTPVPEAGAPPAIAAPARTAEAAASASVPATPPSSPRGARSGVPARAGPGGAIADEACVCRDRAGRMLCLTPMFPSCSCVATPNGSSLCPRPLVDGACLVRGPNGTGPYSASGRRSGEPCSGRLRRDEAEVTVSGLTSCSFCYGAVAKKVPGVPGAPCKGFTGGSPSADTEGTFVCGP